MRPEYLGDHYIHTHIPVQYSVGLLQVQEYLIEELLHNFYQLLDQIIFYGGGTRASSRPRPMEDIVIGYGRTYADVNHSWHFMT